MVNNIYSFFNKYKIYEVPNLFSYQHVLLLLINIVYIILLCLILKNKSRKTQTITLVIINALCVLLFVGRMFFGWESSRIYNHGSKVTLLPLEFCNINIFITLITIITKSKFLQQYLYFASMLGALIPLIIFPECHMITNGNNLFHYMFVDYWFIHTNLFAIPIVMIACGWFKPSIHYILKILLMVFAVFTFVFICSTILRNFEGFESANYMYCYNDTNLPILKQLHHLIPYPYIYLLPIILPLSIVLYLMGLPFCLKRRIKNV